jgi:hypothetical protein
MGGRHLGRGGIGLLGDVGQRLGHCVVGGDLDRLGKLPLDLDIQGDGDGRAAGQRSERRPQPARGEHSRVQATSDLPRFLKHASHPGQRAFQPLGPVRGLPAASPPAPLSCRPRVTGRCWALSCRLRLIRRRAVSPTATIRAREAASSACACALMIAVPSTSVNPASFSSAPAGPEHQHFSELNLVAVRRAYLALLDTGMEPAWHERKSNQQRTGPGEATSTSSGCSRRTTG